MSFSNRRAASAPGDYTRSSDRYNKDAVARKIAARAKKPAHSSRSYAVWLLGRTDYSAVNLRKKLVTRGYSEEEADDAMTFVIERQYQSDDRYAGNKAKSVQNRAGNMRIGMVLKGKGIDKELARVKLLELDPEEQRVGFAAEKFRKVVQADGMTNEDKQKIYRFLAYRGFSAKAIKTAISMLQVEGRSGFV